MPILHKMSVAQQVEVQLRGEILNGYWREEMPGVYQLADEMGVNHKTVNEALRLLEVSGLLLAQGPGRRRKVMLPETLKSTRTLRIVILLSMAADKKVDYIVDLKHELLEAGHAVFLAQYTLNELGMDTQRVARMVTQTNADAWVVLCGSQELLEWFMTNHIPVFAMFGHRYHLPVAGGGPNKLQAFRDVVGRLVSLGHRRIVLLALTARRWPEPGLPERSFLNELAAHGIPTGPYHLPNWEDSPEGLQQILDSLFQTTPPTALLIDEAYLFHAVKHHLANKGIRTPEDVSLVCTDPDPTFTWCHPSIAHIHWEIGPVVRRIVQWADNVARGKTDWDQTPTPAEYVDGGTVGVVKAEMGKS
jgi:DNA-binding LacI/PurR family transcriptional regulator